MTKYPILFLLIFFVLACTLTDPPTQAALSQELETIQASPTPTSPPLLCIVSTGYTGGKLRLRDCGSTQCQELDLLDEGETLIIESSGDWHQVTSSSGISGWINSKFCKLEK